MSMEYRLRRTLPSNRAAIIMPVDHGLIFDRIEGLETPSAPFAAWAGNDVTGFMMTPGQVKQTETFFAAHPHLSRVMAIDTYYDYRVLDGGSHGLITTVEDAVRMGVDAVKMLFPW
ncbi:MAG TPA: deoxyribose-phosphate aldolase, partial [Aestuariivirga sp.]|nr:deoxyribose-phosphate aldolase [Aestuariivirga sp.]